MSDIILKSKSGEWFLKRLEDSFKNFLVPKVPTWIETYHLTWLTFIWSGLVVYLFYQGLDNELFFYAIPLLVLLQYITDLLDGAVGRARNTGLVKWGYYADHFLDFIFMISIIFGYGLVLGFDVWFFLIMALSSAFMVHTYLLSSAAGEFQISFLKMGPTEARVVFMIVHTLAVYNGLYNAKDYLVYLVVFIALALVWVSVVSQAKLWKKDMEIKNNI